LLLLRAEEGMVVAAADLATFVLRRSQVGSIYRWLFWKDGEIV
jgi:hypothetical protein